MKKYLFLSLLTIPLAGQTHSHPLPDNKTLYHSHIEDHNRLHFTVGLIAQQIIISGTDVCLTNETTILDTFSNAPLYALESHKINSIKFDLDVGLKLGLSYNFNHDHWMASANFEWINSKGTYNNSILGRSSYAIPTNNAAIYYRPGESILPIQFQKVESYLKVNHNLLNLYLSKGSYFTDNFSFMPYGGLKVSWIEYTGEQNFSEDGSEQEYIMPAETYWKRSSSIHFWGIGPMAGIEAMYHVVEGWSILSSLQGSVLIGERNFSANQGLSNGNTFTQNILNTQNKITTLSPTISSLLGLKYSQLVLENTQHLTLFIGFDGRVYFNQYPTLYFGTYNGIVNTNISYPSTQPSFLANNLFGMIGCTIDVTWSF